MTEHVQAGLCSNCNCKRVSVRKRKGIAGRVTRTPWYREEIECLHCGILVIAKAPGKGIALWNRSAAG